MTALWPQVLLALVLGAWVWRGFALQGRVLVADGYGWKRLALAGLVALDLYAGGFWR